MLETLEHRLVAVRDHVNTGSGDDKDVSSVIRIAAEAGLLVISKYYALSDDNEVYRIAMGKAPPLYSSTGLT